MKTTAKTSPNPPINLHQVEVRPLVGEEEKLKSRALLDAHHYLKDVRAVGERIRYGVFDAAGQWAWGDGLLRCLAPLVGARPVDWLE